MSISKALVFDIGDVLYGWEAPPLGTTNIPPKMLLAMIATPIWADHDIGKFNEAVCFAKLAEEFDRSPAEVDLAFAMIRDGLQLNKALADLLRSLKTNPNVQALYIMSNISQELFTHLRTRDDGMDWNLFKESFVSGEAGLRKPDAAFYTLVLQRIGLPAENIFFVDDKANNVDAARALGIQGAVYTIMEKLEHAIRDFLG
ncbi:hypothetical protein N7499_004200 [Penicillium canescens]|uniref:Uncharacterized protein n=1 Tax=Penicillium canescens TaxID=5083 RepID=A0AAD6I944_PENCN|nr:uncharacterized protein N7446_005075 [Penicillium canescens]KAJ6038265.1 hypothetical protein N7460_008036 [Penicillium canescens]KAJ6039615.1 hypothetical protein N7444_008520 [Penicillium canescens]KAJ6068038.1 hypothetical protein N7446_005075 [Penicillium canescens]KAJ6088018.1 hypothetical protein N7499_004200 [Penicillium canescens]KAJ6181480.1 hypothetical protein N7485_000122 [Penicillium canescens]